LGANLIVQVKQDRVVRVLPFENEAVNECWLADRDRFAYLGLNAADRLTKPLLKQNGTWHEVEWEQALEYVAHALTQIKAQHGVAAIGALAAPNSTLEELYLLGQLMRGIGSDNIDCRLRQTDFSADTARQGAPWLGMPVAAVGTLNRVLLIGSFLRKDHPLLAARLRAATKRGCQISVVHAADEDLLMPVAAKAISAPSTWVQVLTEIAVAVAALRGLPAPVAGLVPSAAAQAIAASLNSASGPAAILLGNAAVQSPAAAQLHAWAQWLAQALGATLGIVGEAANSVGGYVARAVPCMGGLNAAQMLSVPRKAYLLWNLEPEYDTANPAATARALAAADSVIAFTPFRNGALEYADAILPITPYTETAGTFINTAGLAQSFNGAVRPYAQARPGWKVLRVLGNLLELPGFAYESVEQVRTQALPADMAAQLSNTLSLKPVAPSAAPTFELERLADVPIYASDAIVRRATSLQQTADARVPQVRLNAATLARLGLSSGNTVRVRQDGGSAVLECVLDAQVADGVARIASAHPATAALGAMFGPLLVERA
jgi:NADH-quinone oxidoreductase subunit G